MAVAVPVAVACAIAAYSSVALLGFTKIVCSILYLTQ